MTRHKEWNFRFFIIGEVNKTIIQFIKHEKLLKY